MQLLFDPLHLNTAAAATGTAPLQQSILAGFLAQLGGDFTPAKVDAAFANIMNVIQKLDQIVEKLAPMAQAFAPLAGPDAGAVIAAAGAANLIATATDKAIADHKAGNTTAGLVGIAAAVAASGVADPATTAKINQVISEIPVDGAAPAAT